LFHGYTFCFKWLLKNAVIYFDNYLIKVGTLFNIVHCFILDGKFQGYLVISLYTLPEKEKLQKPGGKFKLQAFD